MDKFVESLKKSLSVVAFGTKKITKTVAEKTGNFVDITKLNIALNDTDKKIEEIYKKIGETVYQAYSEGLSANDDFSDFCEEIDAFVAEQESLKAQIAELKNSVACPVCGQINDKNREFCSKCSSTLFMKNDDNSKNQVIEVVDFEDEE